MAFEILGIKRTAITNYVLRLLSRNRNTLEQIPGDVFVQRIPDLRKIRFTGLVLVDMPGGMLGRLLFQNGRLVFTSQGDLEPQQALRLIQRSVGSSTFIILSLDLPQSVLAFSAVDGIPHGIGMQIPVNREALIAEQHKRGFSGILALEAGASLLIWHFANGHIQFGPDMPQDLERYRLIHIAWKPHELPELLLDTDETTTMGVFANQPTHPAQISQPNHTLYNPPVLGSFQPPIATHSQVLQQPFPQDQPAVVHNSGGHDINTAIWHTFNDVLKMKLVDRAPQVFNQARQSHSLEAGVTLINSLASQLERVAGSKVAQAFRSRFGQ